MDRSRLIWLLNSMFEADFETTRELIETHFDELADPAVDGLIGSLIHAEPDQSLREAIRWHADLIRQCRICGIGEAFSAAKAAQRDSTLNAAALEMTRTPSWSWLRGVIEAHGNGILTDDFERSLRMMASNLDAHLRFLRECRQRGTAATFRLHGVGGPHFSVDLSNVVPSVAHRFRQLDLGGEGNPSPPLLQTETLPLIIAELDRSVHPELWAALQDRLGNQHVLLARQVSTETNLEAAVRAFDRALEIRTEDFAPNEWASTQNNKAIALQSLFVETGRYGRFHVVPEAFESVRRVWTLNDYPHDHAIALNNHGDALRAFGDHEKEGTHYRKALGLLEAAARACDKGLFPDDWAMVTRNIGVVLMRLGELGHDREHLYEAAENLRQAIEVREALGSSPSLTTARNDLGNTLRILGERNGDVEMLREAAVTLRRVASERSRALHPAEWAATQSDLGAALFRQGECEADTASLGEAIIVCRSALEEQRGSPIPMSALISMNTLGAALEILGQRETSEDLLQEAADVLRKVRSSVPRGASVAIWTSATTNLGSSLRSLGDIRRDPALYLESAAVSRSALNGDFRRRSPLEWARVTSNLGDAQFALGNLTSDPALLRDAARSYRLALEERGEERSPVAWAVTQNNLGHALRICGELTRSNVDLDASVQAYRSALVHLRREISPLQWARVVKGLGSAYSSSGRFQEAAELLKGLVSDLVPAIWAARSLEEQHGFLLEAAGVADELAYGLIRLDRIPEALEAIEQGRAILLSQRYNIAADPEVRAALDTWRTASDAARLASGPVIMSAADQGDICPDRIAERAHRHSEAAKAYGELSRLLEKSAGDIPSPVTDLLAAAIPPEGAVVVVVVARAGGAAVVLSASGIRVEAHLVGIPSFTSRALDDLVVGRHGGASGWLQFYAALEKASTEQGAGAALRAWNKDIGPFLDRLWDQLLAPVDSKLRQIGLAEGGEVVIVPPGRLSILPLQAARRTGVSGHAYFVEDWAVSLAPTLRSAARSRAKAHAISGAVPSLLAVTDPLGDLGAPDNPAWPLFATRARARLDGPAATVKATCSMIAGWSHLSFYCHGEWDPDDPENSGLLLAMSERLTIRMLRGVDLSSVRLAILAACETGVIGVHDLPDEFVGLPAALSEAGVPCVLSTLWPVEASVTHRFVNRFLTDQLGGMSPAKALREVQLRMLKTPGGPGSARTVLQGAGSPESGGSADLSNADPAFWAAFVITGA